MFKRLCASLLLVVATVLNIKLFISRWAEEPRTPFEPIVTDLSIASVAIGLCAVVITLAFLELLRSFRVGKVALFLVLSAAVLVTMWGLDMYKVLFAPQLYGLGCGAALALFGFGLRDTSSEDHVYRPVWSFSLMALVSFNTFLLMAPWTTHVPSYVQDTWSDISRLSTFYYGSVHSDLSPISIGLRWIINQFFDHPSINATSMSSMIYLALALGFVGVSIEMAFGRWWGWAALFLAWTDRWLFASAVSSAIIGQPVLSAAYAIFICTWALWRKATPLSWKEAGALGVANAAGLFFNLYGYSAARMTWLVGSGMAALILMARRAVWFNVAGYQKVALALLPSVVMVALIWAFVFGMDSSRFSSQLFISPGITNRIENIDSYRTKLISVHDPDMPIWWGTGRPADGENVSLYWRRTPRELYEKFVWVMKEVSVQQPIPFVLVLLGGFGIVLGITSVVPIRRWFSLCLLLLTTVSFATFILAQDPSAYRRSLATNLLVVVGVVSFFAAKSRGHITKVFAISLCGVLAFLKAPRELNALFGENFWGPVCVNCQPHINVRTLVNDSVFSSVSKQPIRYLLQGQGISPLYSRCASRAFESHEFKTLAPHSSELVLGERGLTRAFVELPAGDVLLASCSPAAAADPDLFAVCQGKPPFGELVVMIPTARKPEENVWWVLVKRL
jgi:hypothetical protein